MAFLWLPAGVLVAGGALWLVQRLRKRNVPLWLPAYVRGDWAGRRERGDQRGLGPVHIMFCIADHFEPGVGRPGTSIERRRVARWVRRYPQLAAPFRDADGCAPRHTFFYPAEQYHAEHLERLSLLMEQGLGEVEVHIHHDRDTSEGTRRKLRLFVQQLRSHGCLGTDRADSCPRFAFIHGNWALDNSSPDGRWCGVNDELKVLKNAGCYADFTMPSAPSPTQSRRINSIYYATDDPHAPRSYDNGEEVRVGGREDGDLMLIQGPLGLTWSRRKLGLFPRLENGDIAAAAWPTRDRVAVWIRSNICVAGKPDWLFVKVHTHGCKEENMQVLLGPPMLSLHHCLAREYNDGARYKLHYVTAREMYNIIKAAERGMDGDPGQYRDFRLLPPARACAGKEGPAVLRRGVVA